MVRFSLTARLLIILVVIGATGLVAVLCAVATTHRSSALQSLRSAIASRDADRIREAIKRAQAAGVSEKDVANMQELRDVLSGKLQSALAGQFSRASFDLPRPAASLVPRATVLPAQPQVRAAS